MPITAETFEPQHFDALTRGLTVAKQAHEALLTALANEKMWRENGDERIAKLEETIDSLPRDWEKLTIYIEDLERGIRTPAEVVECLKGMR